MIAIDSDNTTLHITRGDATGTKYNRLAFQFPILNIATEQEELYEFQPEDKISFVVFEQKGYTKEEILRKDFTISELGYNVPTTTPELILTSEDTKIFPLLDKGKTYWYDLVLNDNTTMLGYDDEGAKQLIIYPEANE